MKIFLMNPRKLVDWSCVSFFVSCICHNSEGREMSAVQHDIAVKISFVNCIVSKDDISSGLLTGDRSPRDTRMVSKSLSEIPRYKLADDGCENEVSK